MIQTRHWKRHLRVGLWVAGVVAAVLTGEVLIHWNNGALSPLGEFFVKPVGALVSSLPPVWKFFFSLPPSVAACNAVLFSAAVWGALAALISAILSLLFSRETKPTPPR